MPINNNTSPSVDADGGAGFVFEASMGGYSRMMISTRRLSRLVPLALAGPYAAE